MRKIINSAFVSLDGVTEDPRSWAIFDPDSGAAQALQGLDAILMGRGTYEYFAEVMPKQTGPYADSMCVSRDASAVARWSTTDRADQHIARPARPARRC